MRVSVCVCMSVTLTFLRAKAPDKLEPVFEFFAVTKAPEKLNFRKSKLSILENPNFKIANFDFRKSKFQNRKFQISKTHRFLITQKALRATCPRVLSSTIMHRF